MPTDVIMPQMGESIFEGTITKWLKKPGESVQRDEPLFEISTDKVDAEIPAPASGVLKEIKVNEGATVQVNTVVGVIDADGAGAQPTAQPAQPAAAPQPAPPPPAQAAGRTTGGAAATDGGASAQALVDRAAQHTEAPATAPAPPPSAAQPPAGGGGPATD